MITTTLNRIKQHRPCQDGWKKLLTGLGKTAADDEPLPFARIVEINGLDDALWCCRAEPQYAREWLLYAVWCARQVQHLMTDPRSVAALDVAERYARGEASDEERAAARKAARDAAWSAARAAQAAQAAAWAARAAGAAWTARDAWAAAWAARAAGAAWTAGAACDAGAAEAARDAAWAAWDAQSAAWTAARAAARDAAWTARAANAAWAARDATLAAQTAEFLRVVTETEAR